MEGASKNTPSSLRCWSMGRFTWQTCFLIMQVVRHWKMKLNVKNVIGIQLGFDCISWYMNLYACNLFFVIFYVNLLCDIILVVHNKCLFFIVGF
jgi:hypothetical protein